MELTGTAMVVILITEFFMVFFLAFGYMVRFRGRIDLLRGHDLSKVQDRAGLGRFVGNGLLALGILAGLVFLFEVTLPDFAPVIFLGYLATIPIVSVWTALGSRRFEKP